MACSVCCATSNLQTELEGLKMNDENYTIITNYRKKLTNMYASYRSKKRLFALLRCLQITGGFMITTLTTYNNPYFKDNSDSIGILVWYISISNNIVNLLTEKLGAYDLTMEKIKINLMIDEGKMYNAGDKNYAFYTDEAVAEKLAYFEKIYKSIATSENPYAFLTRDEENPEHASEIMESKRKRLHKLWTRVPTPPEDSGVSRGEPEETVVPNVPESPNP